MKKVRRHVAVDLFEIVIGDAESGTLAANAVLATRIRHNRLKKFRIVIIWSPSTKYLIELITLLPMFLALNAACPVIPSITAITIKNFTDAS